MELQELVMRMEREQQTPPLLENLRLLSLIFIFLVVFDLERCTLSKFEDEQIGNDFAHL